MPCMDPLKSEIGPQRPKIGPCTPSLDPLKFVNPRPDGGGGAKSPPSAPRFFPLLKNERSYCHQTMPLPPSILHTLAKGIFQGHDRSAVNDVRVASCFPIFVKK